MKKNYYIGLDIGTTSCGFAVTDENYNILRIKGKKAWGVRLFDEAQSAVQRRLQRGNRRRLARKKLKLSWLQQIFKNEIDKIDDSFLTRIKYSNLWQEDKLLMNANINSKDSLFHDNIDGKIYNDKSFYTEYPTIYHLRQELTRRPAKDVRFLYLAIHNIIKRRGHFLYEGEYGDNINIVGLTNANLECIKDFYSEASIVIDLKKLNEDDEQNILSAIQSNKGIKYTKNKMYEIFCANDKLSKKIVDIFVDGKFNIKELFPFNESIMESTKYSFNDDKYDTDILPSLENVLSQEELNILNKLKEIYSTLQLKKVLGNYDYLCDSMVDLYNQHHKQLNMFKKFIKEFYPKSYFDIFRNENNKETNYPAYVNGGMVKNKKQVIGLATTDRTKESFYKYIKKILDTAPSINSNNEDIYNETKDKILQLIDSDNFLPKQRTKTNAVFPNKLYKKELIQILQVNSTKFPFLLDKDEDGLTNIDKILQILEFRIPYFVGPTGTYDGAENTYSWINKTLNVPITPWNIHKVINFDQAEDNFIQRMTNKCTYLKDKDVLPKNSILYSKFRVLNELNNLKIDGNSISVSLKQKIFNDLFKNNKKVTVKNLKDYLVKNDYYSVDEINNIEISGIDKEFANNYSSYFVFKNILGEDFIENNLQCVENIIKYHTIIADKTRLAKRIQREYGDIINDSQLKSIKSLSFNDWGRLSKEFLEDLKFTDLETGEILSIIDVLWDTNQNLQEILFNKKYTLFDVLEKYNKNIVQNITYQDVQDLYCSPAVKRGVWQSIKVVQEIITLMGGMPDKIFVEVTRHDEAKGEKGRKLSRKDNLLKQYESEEFKTALEHTKIELEDILKSLNNTENNAIRSDKLYLYYLQLGKCAYSGESIDITKINNEQYYDIDHIIPQSIIKDDNIENKVLVKSEYNKLKTNIYPIASNFPQWVDKQKPFWDTLVKLKLMSDKKYANLIRREELTDDEKGGFIAKQLVETNQSAKAVIELLKNLVDNPRKIVYSKSKFVSNFRKNYDIPKSREINDLHHAVDAYLNIVVGNVVYNRFTDDPKNFYRKDKQDKNLTKNVDKIFNYPIKNLSNDTLVWNGDSDIKKVQSYCQKKDCLITRMSYCEMNGQFYDETIYKSTKNNPKTKAKIQLKGNPSNPMQDYNKYGGFNNMSIAYYMVIQSEDKKGNIIKTIESVPTYVVRQYRNDLDSQQKIFDYVVKENNLLNAKILMPKLNIKSTVLINKGYYLLAGKTNNYYILHNANQWYVNNVHTNYIKVITKYIDMKTLKKDSDLVEIDDKVIISRATKDNNPEQILTKQQNLDLYDYIIKQLNKKIYNNLALSTTLKVKLEDNSDKFKTLTVLQQAELLYRIIARVKTGSASADLSLLGQGAHIGLIMLSKNITNLDIKLVIQSTAGFAQKIIKL